MCMDLEGMGWKNQSVKKGGILVTAQRSSFKKVLIKKVPSSMSLSSKFLLEEVPSRTSFLYLYTFIWNFIFEGVSSR